MFTIIDVARNVEGFAPAIAARGITTVIRYYNHRNSSRLPDKALSRAELAALTGAGLSVAIVFQQNGGAGGQISDFHNGKGDRDARCALQLAEVLGQPAGSAIYFAVD
ncbi:MAG: DUF1906 domain-containing protein [Paracoccus sp. (in: a-proteobacteria)]|nr:DUF1906 domain-containing protein [Paracoccus sp. (in: a-proteobacteria)]